MNESREGASVEAKLAQLLGGHYSSEFWSELQSHKTADDVNRLVQKLEADLSAADSEEAKESIRKAYAEFKY